MDNYVGQLFKVVDSHTWLDVKKDDVFLCVQQSDLDSMGRIKLNFTHLKSGKRKALRVWPGNPTQNWSSYREVLNTL